MYEETDMDSELDLFSAADFKNIPPKYMPKPGRDISACLFGGPNRTVWLKLYFSEAAYYEAGVMYFGNSGDVSHENAIYWEREEATPLSFHI